MARFHGKDGSVTVGVTDIAQISEFEFSTSSAPAEVTAMKDTHVQRIGGIVDSSGSLTAWWDPGDTLGQEALKAGAAVTLKLYPQGNSSGKKEITVTALITEVGLPVPFDGGIAVSVSFVSTTDFVEATVV